MPWIEYDMKLVKCAHEYGYELNLEIDNMCSLMKFGVLNWWHYEINMRLCALCVENEIVFVHYVKWLLCESKWINDTSGLAMLVDKDLVVVMWHIEPHLVADQDLWVLQWLKRNLGAHPKAGKDLVFVKVMPQAQPC